MRTFIRTTVALYVVCLGSLANGQVVTTATIRGTIRDGSGAPVAQASLEVSSEALIGGTLRITIAPDGSYSAAALPPGVYTLDAATPGFAPIRRTGIRLAAGAAPVIDFTFDTPGVAETILVEARAPLVNVRSTASTSTLDYGFLSQLPVSRNVSSLINLTPGVSTDVAFGGSRLSNALYVDGVTTTSSRLQDPFAQVNFNWIQSAHVEALGAGPEYSGFSGVAANTTLKSGSNRLSGMAEYWTIRPGWMGRNTDGVSAQLQRSFAPRTILTWWEVNANVGGPVVRDRVWYFGGVQRTRHDDRPAGFDGPGSSDEREWQALLKPTLALSSGVRVEGFIEQGNNHTYSADIGPTLPVEVAPDSIFRQTVWNTRLTRTGAGPLIDMRANGSRLVSTEEPPAPNTRSGPIPRVDFVRGNLVNTPIFFDDITKRWTIAASLVDRFDRRLGAHELKAGLEVEFTDSEWDIGYPTNRLEYARDGVVEAVGFWQGDHQRSTTHRFSYFVQDTWSAGRVTVTPGIRVDANRGGVPINGSVFATTPWSPRIGVAWDVTRMHDTVVRAHYGRYHDTIFSDPIVSADASQRSQEIPGVLVDGEWVPSGTSPAISGVSIDPDLKHSYADQYLIGIERQVTRDLTVTAQFITRHFDSFMGFVALGQAWEQVERIDPGPDGVLGNADDGGPITAYKRILASSVPQLYTNPDGLYSDYRAVQFIGRRHFGTAWQVQGSYTWSRVEGWVDNRWHANVGRSNRSSNPNSMINAFGRGNYDPTHEAKVLASVSVPRVGAMISGNYRYITGYAWGRRVQLSDLGIGFPGNVVRVEPNGTRRLPAANQLDVRAEKTLRSGRTTVGLSAEVFNVWNQGIPSVEFPDPLQDLSGRTFGQPRRWSDPRHARAAVRIAF